jgi:hypothetical protein
VERDLADAVNVERPLFPIGRRPADEWRRGARHRRDDAEPAPARYQPHRQRETAARDMKGIPTVL